MASIAKIFFKNYNKIPPLGKDGAAADKNATANFDVAKKETVEIMLHPAAEENLLMREYAKFPTTITILQIANWVSDFLNLIGQKWKI